MPQLVSESLEEGFFGRRLSLHFGIESKPLYSVRRNGRLRLALTRLTSPLSILERTAPIPPEPAFSIIHELSDRELRPHARDRRVGEAASLTSGAVSVLDLSDAPRCDLSGLVDALQYYLPKKTLEEFAHEHGAPPILTLLCRKEERDPVVATLSNVLLTAIEEGISANQLLIDHLALSLVAHCIGADPTDLSVHILRSRAGP